MTMKVFTYIGMAAITTVYGYQQFQTRIPNGDRVPDPCDSSKLWSGVGHFHPGGRGTRNIFGMDFKDNNLTWYNSRICMMDSDGDGRTNGEELGDPDCIWKPETTPTRTSGLSHPGICEPLDSPRCKERNKVFGSQIECNQFSKSCEAISEPGIMKKDLRFPVTPIPSDVTNYHCMLFDLPSGGDYQIVATTPLINNSAIVHHIIMFGCDIPENASDKTKALKVAPYKCGMSAHQNCQQIIGTWTIGSDGDCASRDSGFRAGTHGYRVAALQVHWNNPERLSDQEDSSGLTIYYTKSRRPYDAAIFMVGQEHLLIPPYAKDITFDASCPGDCTREIFPNSIFITRAVNHMHYMGKSQVVSLYRDGRKLRDFTNDQAYNYDHPQFYHFDPPIEVKPGDEIRTQCKYSSYSPKPVNFGAGTSDEMCYGFLTYYPVTHSISTTFCASWKSVQRCRRYLPRFNGMIGDCEWRKLINIKDPETQRIYANFYTKENCGYYAKNRKCHENCTRVASDLLTNPCLQGDIGDWVRHKMSLVPEGQLLVNALRDCGVVSSSNTLKCLNSVLYVVFTSVLIMKLTLT